MALFLHPVTLYRIFIKPTWISLFLQMRIIHSLNATITKHILFHLMAAIVVAMDCGSIHRASDVGQTATL
jgi:hypothetical protein